MAALWPIPEPDEPCELCGATGEVRWSLVWPEGERCRMGWRCVGKCEPMCSGKPRRADEVAR